MVGRPSQGIDWPREGLGSPKVNICFSSAQNPECCIFCQILGILMLSSGRPTKCSLVYRGFAELSLARILIKAYFWLLGSVNRATHWQENPRVIMALGGCRCTEPPGWSIGGHMMWAQTAIFWVLCTGFFGASPSAAYTPVNTTYKLLTTLITLESSIVSPYFIIHPFPQPHTCDIQNVPKSDVGMSWNETIHICMKGFSPFPTKSQLNLLIYRKSTT